MKPIKLRFSPDSDGVLRATFQDEMFHWHFAMHIYGKKEIRWNMSSHNSSEEAHGVANSQVEAKRAMLAVFCAFAGFISSEDMLR
jgi:hypothetical protein